MNFDYSTLNLDELRKLPRYKLPPSYHLQRDHGCGCIMHPPGYPTYFLQAVYTQSGFSPPHTAKADEVITFEGVHYITSAPCEKRNARHGKLMRRLWAPLPLEHERVKLWIRACYRYFARGYEPETGEKEVAKLIFADDGPRGRYRPYTYVREFYPEHVFDEDLRKNPPKDHEGDWWEREAMKPSPETCVPPGWLGRHPSSGTWCQHCGWHAA